MNSIHLSLILCDLHLFSFPLQVPGSPVKKYLQLNKVSLLSIHLIASRTEIHMCVTCMKCVMLVDKVALGLVFS
jgi:hypothetical protein